MKEQNRRAWRYFFPFFLLVGLFLLAVFRVVRGGGPAAGAERPVVTCDGSSEPYTIVLGDTCWDVADKFGIEVDALTAANPGLDCQQLVPGHGMCVPQDGDVVEGAGKGA